MSEFGGLFVVRAAPRGGEDRGFGGAVTPELSGAFDQEGRAPDITRGHVSFRPTIGSSVAPAMENVAEIGATNNTEFGPFNLSSPGPQLCV